jgi:5-methyltetrahydropteroyltriglutamate--homocysteine methyltransferase
VSPPLPLIPTTVVGSHPQPGWLIDRRRLLGSVPRVRVPDAWRVAAAQLVEAQDDAARLAIADMERAGIDVVSDGECRRESYSSAFATGLDGIDGSRPAMITTATGHTVAVPRVVGRVRRTAPVERRAAEFLRAATTRPVKVTLPGPFTLSRQVANEFYEDPDELVLDYADALAAELRDLEDAGVDVLQLDEPWLRTDPAAAERIAVPGIDRALAGVRRATTAVHLCFGYAAVVGSGKPHAYPFLESLAACSAEQISIEAAQPRLDLGVLDALAHKTVVLGVLDLGDATVETPQAVAQRLRAALAHVEPERLVAAPDCGMKYLPRATACGKLAALAAGAAIVRAELTGERP